jgi:hypothetical protein
VANLILTKFFVNEETKSKQQKMQIDSKAISDCFGVESKKLMTELIDNIKKFERVLNPNKKYYFSDKMDLINPSISKNNTTKIINFIKELIENKEYLAVNSFYSETKKFFQMDSLKLIKNKNKIIEEESPNKKKTFNNIEKENENKESSLDIEEEVSDKKVIDSYCDSLTKKDSMKSEEKQIKKTKIGTEFSDKVNKSTSELNSWDENFAETNINLQRNKKNNDRRFFGYYNFHNFFNHFVILYERLKLMKSLTDQQGIFPFMKRVIMLNITNVIDSDFFGDVIGCLFSEYTGLFLNLEKTLSNIVKEIPSNEIDRFVVNLNHKLFNHQDDSLSNLGNFQEEKNDSFLIETPQNYQGFPNRENEEAFLFLKTCHKLSSLSFRNKSGCKQSQIQSYINNNNLVNDHILKFEFRSKDQVFVIHKVKSLYKNNSKQVNYFIF